MIRRRILLLILVLAIFSVNSRNAYAQSNAGRLYFNPDTGEVSNGSEFTTDIYLDTDGAESGGAGVILNFNPVLIEAVETEPGIIFDDYPLAVIDNEAGKVSISGISGSRDQLFTGNDLFARVTWRALKTGTTQIGFEFETGSTTDSNIAVTFGNGDILSEVGNLDLSISVGAATAVQTASPSTSNESTVTSDKNIVDRALDSISRLFGQDPEGEIDPYAPIVRRDPITNLSEDGSVAFTSESQGLPTRVIIGAVLIAISILGIIIFAVMKMRRKKESVVVVPPTGM